MKKNSTNPGLVFNRYYFEARYDKCLNTAARSNHSSFKLRHLLEVPKDKEVVATAHFKLRNQQLYDFSFDPLHLTTDPATARKGPKSALPSTGTTNETLTVDLKTTYPGLMVGLGYNHQVAANDAINGGFSFDHTTGLPIIPGPSVKGILRAAFPFDDRTRATRQAAIIQAWEKAQQQQQPKNDVPANEAEQEELPPPPEISDARRLLSWYTSAATAKASRIIAILNRIAPIAQDWSEAELKPLHRALFDATYLPEGQEDIPGNLRAIQVPARVVFHAASIVNGDADGRILGPDNITPHVNPDGLGNGCTDILADRYVEPNPISFVKVLPNVTFRFSFYLPASFSAYQNGNRVEITLPIAANTIRRLFTELLLHYGVGAKTRVCYGSLIYQSGITDWPTSEVAVIAPRIPYDQFSSGSFPKAFDHVRFLHGKATKEVVNAEEQLQKGSIVNLLFTRKVGAQFYFNIVPHDLSVNTKKKGQPNFPNQLSTEEPIKARIDDIDDDGIVTSFTIL